MKKLKKLLKEYSETAHKDPSEYYMFTKALISDFVYYLEEGAYGEDLCLVIEDHIIPPIEHALEVMKEGKDKILLYQLKLRLNKLSSKYVC